MYFCIGIWIDAYYTNYQGLNKMDLYTTNNDYTGSRTMEQNKELVEYHANSNHRIWYNEQTEGFDAHWHTAMEIIIPIENYYDIIINNENIKYLKNAFEVNNYYEIF